VFRSWGKRPPVAGTAVDIARTLRSSDWKRLSAGAGTKGPRLHDWCYLELADLEAEEANSTNQGPWTRGLLIRRRIADGDLAFFTTWCPAATSIEMLVEVEGHRWAIEDSFETAKNEFRARSQREPILPWLASSRFHGHARLRHDGGDPTSR
jgi:SRSO17 transposase